MYIQLFYFAITDEIVSMAFLAELLHIPPSAEGNSRQYQHRALACVYRYISLENVREWIHAVGKQLSVSESELYLHACLHQLHMERYKTQTEEHVHESRHLSAEENDSDAELQEAIELSQQQHACSVYDCVSDMRSKNVLKKLRTVHAMLLLLCVCDIPLDDNFGSYDCLFLSSEYVDKPFMLSCTQLQHIFSYVHEYYAEQQQSQTRTPTAAASKKLEFEKPINMRVFVDELNMFMNALKYLPVHTRRQSQIRHLFLNPELETVCSCVSMAVLLCVDIDEACICELIVDLVRSTLDATHATTQPQGAAESVSHLVPVLQRSVDICLNAVSSQLSRFGASLNDLQSHIQSLIDAVDSLVLKLHALSTITDLSSCITTAIRRLYACVCRNGIDVVSLLIPVAESDAEEGTMTGTYDELSLLVRFALLDRIITHSQSLFDMLPEQDIDREWLKVLYAVIRCLRTCDRSLMSDKRQIEVLSNALTHPQPLIRQDRASIWTTVFEIATKIPPSSASLTNYECLKALLVLARVCGISSNTITDVIFQELASQSLRFCVLASQQRGANADELLVEAELDSCSGEVLLTTLLPLFVQHRQFDLLLELLIVDLHVSPQTHNQTSSILQQLLSPATPTDHQVQEDTLATALATVWTQLPVIVQLAVRFCLLGGNLFINCVYSDSNVT